ncbi:MAG: hypothetical protein IPK19_15285 [Chloroflexi bacterium]|nr:hypothetical protein [Chloroflexota bacterium]
MSSWCSIFCATEDRESVVATVRGWFSANGYASYDPFDIIPGPAYPVTVKGFAAPAARGFSGPWVRLILAEPAPALAEALALVAPTHALDLESTPGGASMPGGAIAGVDLSALDGQTRAMAGKVDLKKAGAMADKMLGSLGSKIGASDADANAARALLSQGRVDWSSGAGARLATTAANLGLPDSWHTPDFTTLRDAYAVHKRLERSPRARLYPGDAEARDAVPAALTYIPIFGGKQA